MRLISLELLSNWLPIISQLDRKYITLIDTNVLIDKNPELVDHLTVAWKNKNFEAIRALGMCVMFPRCDSSFTHLSLSPIEVLKGALYIRPRRNPLTSEKSSLSESTVTPKKIPLPFDREFHGKPAIIQSSGTGKSRMVHEQSNLVFTILFNLREEAANFCKL